MLITLRIVPRGAPAQWDEDDIDLNAPCDLVVLEHETKDEDDPGVERAREEHPDGHAASKRICEIVRRPTAPGAPGGSTGPVLPP